MSSQTLDWRTELRGLLFTRDAHQRLWQIAFFAALMIPPMLIFHRTAADVLCGLIGVLFLMNSASNKTWGWLRDPMMIVLFAAWGWMVLVVTPFASNIPTSASIALPWIRFPLFFAAMCHWVFTEEKLFKAMGLWLALILIFIVVDTMWQYVYGVSLTNHYPPNSGRLTGPFNNVKVGIYLSRIILPTVGLCIFFSMNEARKNLAVAIYALLFCFVLMTIAVSGERAPFGTAVIGIVTVLTVIAMKEHKLRLTCLILIAATITMVYGLITTQAWIYSRLVYTLDLAVNFRYTSYGQLFWMAWDMGTEHLFTGVGMKNFRDVALEYVHQGLARHHNLHPHHPYLEWFAETGVVGLLLFVTFVIQLFASALRSVRHAQGKRGLLAVFILGTLIILFFPLVPTQSFFANWPAILFWFSLSLAMAALNICRTNAPGDRQKSG